MGNTMMPRHGLQFKRIVWEALPASGAHAVMAPCRAPALQLVLCRATAPVADTQMVAGDAPALQFVLCRATAPVAET